MSDKRSPTKGLMLPPPVPSMTKARYRKHAAAFEPRAPHAPAAIPSLATKPSRRPGAYVDLPFSFTRPLGNSHDDNSPFRSSLSPGKQQPFSLNADIYPSSPPKRAVAKPSLLLSPIKLRPPDRPKRTTRGRENAGLPETSMTTKYDVFGWPVRDRRPRLTPVRFGPPTSLRGASRAGPACDKKPLGMQPENRARPGLNAAFDEEPKSKRTRSV